MYKIKHTNLVVEIDEKNENVMTLIHMYENLIYRCKHYPNSSITHRRIIKTKGMIDFSRTIKLIDDETFYTMFEYLNVWEEKVEEC